MFDAKRLLDQLVNNGAASGFAGGVAGGALTSLLMGRRRRGLVGSAVRVGGLALVGTLAYQAWQRHQQEAGVTTTATPDALALPPPGSAFLPAEEDSAACGKLSLLLARSMIAAAKADGHIDAEESQAILNQINSSELTAEDKAFLFEEFSKPLDIAGLARDVDSPEHAAEVYTAALLMVESPSAPEQIFLDGLADALRLEPGLRSHIQATVAASQAA